MARSRATVSIASRPCRRRCEALDEFVVRAQAKTAGDAGMPVEAKRIGRAIVDGVVRGARMVYP
jgi:hypothetical protein